MRNTWKGLFVGGLTGVVAGLIVEGVSGLSRWFTTARERAPELAGKARTAAEKAAAKARESDLPERARHSAEQAADRLRSSELPDKAKQVAGRVAERAREAESEAAARIKEMTARR